VSASRKSCDPARRSERLQHENAVRMVLAARFGQQVSSPGIGGQPWLGTHSVVVPQPTDTRRARTRYRSTRTALSQVPLYPPTAVGVLGAQSVPQMIAVKGPSSSTSSPREVVSHDTGQIVTSVGAASRSRILSGIRHLGICCPTGDDPTVMTQLESARSGGPADHLWRCA